MDATERLSHEQLSNSELRRRLLGLEMLLDVTRHVAADVDLMKVLRTVANEACKALDCDRASLYQYDPRSRELYTLVVTELEIAEIRHHVDQGITGHVARNREIANVPNPSADPRWNSSIDRATGYQTRNILAGPLVSPTDGKLLGVLQAINKRGGDFGSFDEQLLRAFSQHAAVALDRARLVEELRRRSQLDASLNVARDIQRGFMPIKLPEIAGYETATWWFPNEAVGGDYCDVVQLNDGRIALVIADVSGHGLGPSLLMASVRAALRALTLQHSAADVLLELLSRSLLADLQDGRFITMFLAEVDPRTHVVEYANAGHAPAIHFSARRGRFASLESTGLPLGVLEEATYARAEPIAMEVGDLLILCTDGIVEAMNRDDEQFGQARLEQIVRANADQPVADIVRRVGETVEAHYVGESPADDLTILATRRNA